MSRVQLLPFELDERVAKLALQRSQIADELNEVTRSLRVERMSHSSVWALTPTTRDTTLTVYIFSCHNTDAAVKVLRDFSVRRGWPRARGDVLHSIVEDLLLASDSDKFASLTDIQEQLQPRLLRDTLQYRRDWRFFVGRSHSILADALHRPRPCWRVKRWPKACSRVYSA